MTKQAQIEFIYAIIFAIAIFAVIFGLAFLGFANASTPLILGSELNGDGTVEYLCLGSSCDNLTKMDW